MEAGEGELKPKFLIHNLTTKQVISESRRPILKGINGEIPKLIVVGIIGPSGSGKSNPVQALNQHWEPPPETEFMETIVLKNIFHVSIKYRKLKF
ncbi:hypothetical protein RHMOL_Rhmol12G0134300 [Rhododendron molle]|uniref:Uncharacterized protein n=1 Tax=Rhododendron molle TaxID=49168 RepID=A0ACC0LHI7_RHOML|nr:hypothetical protein RHMOL_Rhmol12G0134300 [Rhododendron molle]